MSKLLPVFFAPIAIQQSGMAGEGAQDAGTSIAQLGPGKYLLFADPTAVDLSALPSGGLEGVEIQVIPVIPRGDQTIIDVVLLYQLDGNSGPTL